MAASALLLCSPVLTGLVLLRPASTPLLQRTVSGLPARMSAMDSWDGFQSKLQHAPRDDPLPVGSATQMLGSMKSAWVLVFHLGTDDEATYMLQDRQSPTAEQLLLTFELQEDALRFSQQLEAEGFPGAELAQPVERKTDYLRGFCEHFSLRVAGVPAGMLALPPTAEQQQEAAGGLNKVEETGPSKFGASAIERMRKYIEDRFYDI